MAFKEVQNLDAQTVISLGGYNKALKKDNPTSIEGYFLGSKKVESKKAKSGFAYIHILQTPKGNLGVWGKTDMDRRLQAVTAGNLVRITSNGTRPTPNGDMYVYKVEVDTENTIEVASFAGQTAEANDELTEEAYDDNPNAEFDRPAEETFKNTAPRTPKAAPTAAAQANVKALLNSKRA